MNTALVKYSDGSVVLWGLGWSPAMVWEDWGEFCRFADGIEGFREEGIEIEIPKVFKEAFNGE